MPDMGGLQLLPETRKKIEIKIPGENRLIAAGWIMLAITIALAGGLSFFKNSLENKLTSLDAEVTALEQQRNKQAEKNILIFNKQLSMLTKLLNEHAYWTTAFSKIEGLTQSQVQFNSMITSFADGKIDIRATAANYTTIARQIAAFVSDGAIKDVALNKVSILTSGRLEFSMKIIFDKTKLLSKKSP